jgi:hypothetical protein
MKPVDHHGEPTHFLGTDSARISITPRGGHLRIEYRDAGGEWHSPYSLPPWRPDECPDAPALLQILRGDFFCFPFGVTSGLADPHGETANRVWNPAEASDRSATFVMELESMPGRVTKKLAFDPGALLLRQEHLIDGVEGVFNYGHHPILRVPEGQKAILSTSPIRFGQVYPNGFAVAAEGETSALKNGARFSSMDRVETADGGSSTLSEYPVRPAAEDLVMFAAASSGWAWNAFFIPGCLWLSFRKVEDFPSSLYWMSNGGRPQAPWNGRHTGRIGIEDICSHFHDGAHISARDLLNDHRIATARRFQPDQPVALTHWQCLIPTDLPPCRIEQVEIDAGRLIIQPQGSSAWTTESDLL